MGNDQLVTKYLLFSTFARDVGVSAFVSALLFGSGMYIAGYCANDFQLLKHLLGYERVPDQDDEDEDDADDVNSGVSEPSDPAEPPAEAPPMSPTERTATGSWWWPWNGYDTSA